MGIVPIERPPAQAYVNGERTGSALQESLR